MSRDKNPGLSADDRRVWQKIAETVKPMPPHYDKATFAEILDSPPGPVEPVKCLPKYLPVQAQHKIARPLPELAVGHMPGLDRRTAERVTRGALGIDARLDLHGLTRDQAQSRLMHFIARAYEMGNRAILVITGKGQAGSGVLKSEVPRWLNLPHVRAKVLGFSYAQPKDGGDGALYVLIKRRRA